MTLVTCLSCSVEKRAQRHFNKAIALNPELIKSSTIVKTKDSTIFNVKDSTVITKIPATNITQDFTNLCDSLGRLKNFHSVVKSGHTTSEVSAKDGVLVVKCNTDSLESVNRTLSKDKEIYKSAYESTKSVINTPKKFSLKEWFKNGLQFCALMLGLWFGGKFALRYFKIIK